MIGATAVCVPKDLVKDLRFLERTQAGTNAVNVGTERCRKAPTYSREADRRARATRRRYVGLTSARAEAA